MRARVNSLPADICGGMASMLTTQHEELLLKITEVSDLTSTQLKQLERATTASKISLVIESLKAELKEWAAEVVAVSVDAAAERSSESMLEASRSQQAAIFAQLATLQDMGCRLEAGALSRSDLNGLKEELAGLIRTVNDNVSVVRDKVDAMQMASEQLLACVDELRIGSLGQGASLEAATTLLQDCVDRLSAAAPGDVSASIAALVHRSEANDARDVGTVYN